MRQRFTKKERQIVYDKYNGHCAYCGCEIPFKGFNVDHLHCLRHYEYTEEFTGIDVHSIENLMPSCGSCNRYKATMDLETFRRMLSGIPKRLARDVCTYNIAVRFGLIEEHHEPIRFYFERMDKEMENCGNREFHKMMDNGEWGCNNMESDNYGCETDFGDYCIDHEERKSNER